jgi:hypothetical protein
MSGLKSFIKLFIIVFTLSGNISAAQNTSASLWSKSDKSVKSQERTWYPDSYQTYSLNLEGLTELLTSVPMEKAVGNHTSDFVIALPMPDGSFRSYSLVESPIMEPGLAAQFPAIKTYAGRGVEDRTATIRCDITLFGFHAYVLSENGTVYIDAVSLNDINHYLVYYKKDVPTGLYNLNCFSKDETDNAHRESGNNNAMATLNLRTYRLALAADYEYVQFFGGTLVGALSAITTTMNRVNGIYERELDIHLSLISNEASIIYTSSADPYSNNSPFSLIDENQQNLDNVIGDSNYDVGHVFTTAGGGYSFVRATCASGYKGKSETGLSNPVGDAFAVDYVAHEIGHEFGANHPFNSEISACGGGNRFSSSAYEPGSGSTIMAYAGICGSDNLQSHSDAYFHTQSFDEIVLYSQSGTGSTCAVTSNSGNNYPLLDVIPSTYYIPINTPFKLTAQGHDPDGEPITYCWEEFDLGPASTWNNPSGNAPIFRSFPPTSNPTRSFPKLADILDNTTSVGEIKPSYARDLHFRCTVRDNHSGCGGVFHSSATTIVHVVNAPSTGFTITSPACPGVVWDKQTEHTIKWDVAGTSTFPINTGFVNIYLSADGGYNFTDTIALHIDNIGAYAFYFPDYIRNSSQSTHWDSVRIMVEGDGNIFFNINHPALRIDNYDNLQCIDSSSHVNLYPSLIGQNGYNTYTLHFTLESLGSSDYMVSIFDMSGKSLGQFTFQKKYEKDERYIDVSNIASGLYFARFDLPDGKQIKKFAITKTK